jgi:DNA-binding transcriptional MerR regulator
MRIGELAEAVGVSTRAVRHYHRIGLLPEPPRRVNGYRTYGVRDVLRLARVRRPTELGLSLDEAAAALVAAQYREVLHDPEVVARTAELYRRFDELATRSVDDPEVTELARDFAAAVPTELVSGIDPGLDLDAHPFAAAFLRDLAPAQAEAVRRVYGIWSGR